MTNEDLAALTRWLLDHGLRVVAVTDGEEVVRIVIEVEKL